MSLRKFRRQANKNPRVAKKRAAEEYIRTLHRVRNLRFKYRFSAAWHILLAGHSLRSLPLHLWTRCSLWQRVIFSTLIIAAGAMGITYGR